ncbi:MAG: site-2 protease family protein, partial [Lentisphaeria bacterium]
MQIFTQIISYIGIGLFVVFFFGFCVFIHELGHLLVALWRGLHVTSFSIGFGKRLCGFKYKNVDYKISMLPFGGYVELPQLETAEEHFDADGNLLPKVKPFDRLLTAFAGPFFNILFGLFLGSIIWVVGIDKPIPGNSVIVEGVLESSPENKAGLLIGDEIIKVNGKSFKNGYADVFEMITLSTKESVNLTVMRAGKELDIIFTPAESRNSQMEKLWAPQFYGQGKVVI